MSIVVHIQYHEDKIIEVHPVFSAILFEDCIVTYQDFASKPHSDCCATGDSQEEIDRVNKTTYYATPCKNKAPNTTVVDCLGEFTATVYSDGTPIATRTYKADPDETP